MKVYIFLCITLYRKIFILHEFLREHDPHGKTMGVSIGRSSIAPPVRDVLVTLIGTPLEQHIPVSASPEQHMPGCAHDVGDAECDPIAHFQVIFPGSSHVTSTRTLLITFLVDDGLFPMKLEKLPGI